MSQNVEIVRRVYSLLADLAAFRRGDYDDVFLDYFSPDHELIPPPIYPDTPSFYRGLEGVHQFLRLMDEVWVDWGFEAERLFDRGDRVVVFVRTSGTARQSGATVEIPAAHVLTVRDRRVTRTEAFLDRQEGLEAARLGKRRHDVPRSTCDSGPLRHSW